MVVYLFFKFPTPSREGILDLGNFSTRSSKHVDASLTGLAEPTWATVVYPSRSLPLGPKLLSPPLCRDFVYFAITCYIKAAKSLLRLGVSRIFLFLSVTALEFETTTSLARSVCGNTPRSGDTFPPHVTTAFSRTSSRLHTDSSKVYRTTLINSRPPVTDNLRNAS